jgi:hypothetical protein
MLAQGTHEWQDGVLARIMRTCCKDEALDQKWILFDGPVDTLWIESMNTTLDDNKLLTLLSGVAPPAIMLSCRHLALARMAGLRAAPWLVSGGTSKIMSCLYVNVSACTMQLTYT